MQSFVANRSIPNKMVGQTTTTEEIWIDGIDHLEKAPIVNQITNDPLNKDSTSSGVRASLPFGFENNINISQKNTLNHAINPSDRPNSHIIGNNHSYVQNDRK